MISDLSDEVASALAEKVLVPILGLGLSHAALRMALERFAYYRRAGSPVDTRFLNSLPDYRRITGEARWLWFRGISVNGMNMFAITSKTGTVALAEDAPPDISCAATSCCFAYLYPQFHPPSLW